MFETIRAWVKRHRVWSAIIALLLLFILYRIVRPTPHDYEYVSETVTRGEVLRKVSASGKIRALNTIKVGTEVSGQVTKVYVDFNSPVKAGQVLAEIDSTRVRARVQQSEAQVALARAGLQQTVANVARARSELEIQERDFARQRALAERGYDFVAGLEVEFHLFKLENAKLGIGDAGQPGEPPEVSLLNQGYQYLTEQRYDEMDPILEILRTNLVDLGLPLRTLEVEFGPSQVEFTFRTGTGLDPADTMVLFRSATKQIAQRNGFHATFMCRPKLANVMSSGWHLHQSLTDRTTHANAFADGTEPLSATGRHYMAGLLEHARAAAAFSTPTLNGYKRYRPFSLAPDRAIWGRDNRGVMVRVLGGPGDPATHLENRVGEPAANPYLYMASQIVCGLDGLERRLEPGPSAHKPYATKAALLPRSLGEALAALKESQVLRAGLGDFFVDYYLRLKQAEIDRFELEVSDWEQREYFSLF